MADPQAQDAHALDTIARGIGFACDSISVRDGVDCGECSGCKAYDALALLRSRLVVLERELDEREKVLAELEQAAWAVIEKLNPQVPWMDEALELQHKLVATGRARRADERKEN